MLLCLLKFHGKCGNEQAVLAGHKRNIRPAMYLQAWTPMCDLVLLGDLLASNGLRDLSSDGQHLKDSLQACEFTVQQALDHDWFADCVF